MILSSHGIIGSSISQFTSGLLDTYTGAAAAYSLRRLSIAYTGSAIRVRRASDNSEQDIGFVGEDLNTSALTTFCSGTNGFVTKWYDQSGNARNATQATALNQPQIVSAGSVILGNSKSTLSFLSGLSGLDFATFSASSVTMFMIVKAKNDPALTDADSGFVSFGAGATNHYPYRDGVIYDDSFTNSRKTVGNPTTTLAQLNLYNVLSKSTEWTARLNTAQIFTTASNTVTINTLPKIGSKTSIYGMNNFISELIIYPSDQSSNRTGIESNINLFYSLY